MNHPNVGFIIHEEPIRIMPPTRRRYLLLAGAGVGVGGSGCLSGSNITYPEQEVDTDPGDNSGEPAEPDEPEEPPVENINPRLASETTDIYDELRWFETEHDETIDRYQSRIREVVDAIDSLLESLDADGQLGTDQLGDVRDFANEVVSGVNEIPEPYFNDHFNYPALNNSHFPEIERFTKLEDWERVRTELEKLRSSYRGASSSRALDQRYSPNPIDNRLFDWFGGESAETMFEVRYISDDPNHHPDIEDQDVAGYGVYILNDATRNIKRYTPIGRAPLRVLSSMNEQFAPFEVSTDRSYRFYVQVHSVGGSGDVDPETTESMPIYGQKYEDLRAADAAFESVMGDKLIEGKEQWGEETWNQVLYTRNGRRIYGYFIRAGSYLFAIGPSRTPWGDREDDWDKLITGTWLKP